MRIEKRNVSVLSIMAGAFFAFTSCQSPTSPTAQAPATQAPAAQNTASPKTAVKPDISAVELAKKYAASRSDANDKYEGKVITVRGYAFVKPTTMESDGGRGVVNLDEKDGDGKYQVPCYFDAKDKEEFAKVKGSQYITVTGTYEGDVMPEIRSCRLVGVE
jgi:hypothetical protein